MTTYYDDNFGHWEDMDDPEMVDFYHQMQRESVEKKCQGCGRMVKIKADYAYCNGCADIIERGGDVGYFVDDEGPTCADCGELFDDEDLEEYEGVGDLCKECLKDRKESEDVQQAENGQEA